jgi:hypothetical protein
MGQVCFAQIGVEFKNKVTPAFKNGSILNKAIRGWIEETTGEKDFSFSIYNFFHNKERNNISFELSSGREQNLEWQVQQVVKYFKQIEPDLLDFNTNAWVSMDLNYSIGDLIEIE